jgi:hypothetical protein
MRLNEEISRWLQQNGWPDEAARYQRLSQKMQRRVAKTGLWCSAWEKMIADIALLAFA